LSPNILFLQGIVLVQLHAVGYNLITSLKRKCCKKVVKAENRLRFVYRIVATKIRLRFT